MAGRQSQSGPGAVRREVLYRGRVQGVGFRYSTRQLAADRAVTGFVQNLPDGRVRLVVEGPAADVGGLLAAVRSKLGQHIAGEDIQEAPATGEFPAFTIQT